MSYDKHQATHEFTRWSESYDRCILAVAPLRPVAPGASSGGSRAVAGDRPMRVLDVGCGTGVFAARIREALPRAQVWGVDLVSDMLAKGAERWRRACRSGPPGAGRTASGSPFAAGTFDVVTCANSFHHYPHQDRAVAEMHRVLRPGGRLMLIDGYRDAPWGWFIYDVCVAGGRGGRPPRLVAAVPRAVRPGRACASRPEGPPRPRPVPADRGGRRRADLGAPRPPPFQPPGGRSPGP